MAAVSPTNMKLGLEESVSSRWKDNRESHELPPILWCCVSRDETVLAQICCDDDPKVPKIAERLMRKPPKTGWDYYTYAVQSQRRLVQATKFYIYERIPFPAGKRVRLRGLEEHTFLNGATVRVLDYYPDKDKYLIRPTIPLPEDQKLSSTGQLIVKGQHLVAETRQEYVIWTVACLFDGHTIQQSSVCSFIEKIVMISETFRHTDEWANGEALAAQKSFAPILQAQVEQISSQGDDAFHDDSLDFTKEIIAKNILLLSESTM